MADKNRNGIDDALEGKASNFESGRNNWDFSGFGGGRTYKQTPYYKPGFLGIGELGNFAIDRFRDLDNFWDSNVLGNERPQGGGLGDYRWGSAPRRSDMSWMDDLLGSVGKAADVVMGSARQGGPQIGNTSLPSFMDFLTQAQSQFGGYDQLDPVSYDPLRQSARSRATEYDAKLDSMYRQLQNEMQGSHSALDEQYAAQQEAQAANTQAAQQSIQGASNVADDRNAQVLANLGQGEAAANIVAEGRDLNTDTARAVQDAAARGQLGADQITQNRGNAGEYGTRLVSAAGMEGNEQRSRVQSELSQLLAQYDMQEQQANQQVAEANRQTQAQSFAQSLGLANALYDSAWKQRGYEDDMSKWLYEQQMAANQPAPPDRFQLGVDRLGALQSQYPDLDPDALAKILAAITSSGKL